MDKVNKNWVKAYIVDVLPCIAIALYILAIIYNISFFSVFNINIIPYISFSDLLLCIIEPLLVLVFFSLVFFGTVFGNVVNYKQEDKNKGFNVAELFVAFFKFLKFDILIKKIGEFKYIKRIKDKYHNWYEKTKKENEEKDKEYGYHIWSVAILTSIILSLFYYSFFNLKDFWSQGGLTRETVGLIYPIMCISLIYPFCRNAEERIKKFRIQDTLIILIVYYFYSLVVFYNGGIESGEYYKNNSIVSFEIKTTEGSCFKDSDYQYIDYVNGYYFLIEKETENVVILNKATLSYARLNFIKDENLSVIMKLFGRKLTTSSIKTETKTRNN